MPKATWNGAVLAQAEDDEVEIVEGKINKDAAWYYPVTKPAAENVAGYIAFWKGVSVD